MKLKYLAGVLLSALFIISCGGEEGEVTNDRLLDEDVETLHNQLEVKLTAYKAPNGLWGYKNQNNEVAIEARFIAARDFFKEGTAAVADTNGWFYIDTKGKKIIEPVMVEGQPDPFNDDLARFQADGKFGYFDKSGMIVIEAKFDKADPFSEGMAAVCTGGHYVTEEGKTRYVGGKWGYVDVNGELAIEPVYSSATAFQDGKAKVKSGESTKYINKSGKTVSN